MSDGQANVRYEALIEFESTVRQFGDSYEDAIAAAHTTAEHTLERLKDKKDSLRHEIARLREEISNAGEDEDTGPLLSRISDAEAQLSKIGRCQRLLEDKFQAFKFAAVRTETLCSETSRYLRGVGEDLQAYFALQPEISHSITQPTTSGASPLEGERNDGGAFDPTDFRLPAGFRWIRIDSVNSDKDLVRVQNKDDFKKIPYASMIAAFKTLREEVLPAVKQAKGVEYFTTRDTLSGASYEEGLLHVYEAFFGNDPIYLTRGRQDAKFSITNGRHRIKAAIDAGWTAVPAKISDLKEQ